MISYGDIIVSQRLSYWLVAWRHQAINWTNADLSAMRPIGIEIKAIFTERVLAFNDNKMFEKYS